MNTARSLRLAHSLWLPLLLALALLSGCATPGQSTPSGPAISHIILVWLKEPGNAAHRRQVIETTHLLKNLPSVRDLRVGEPLVSDRAIVDDSFDVAVILRFASAADHAAYVNDAEHRRLVGERIMPYVANLRIHTLVEDAGTAVDAQ